MFSQLREVKLKELKFKPKPVPSGLPHTPTAPSTFPSLLHFRNPKRPPQKPSQIPAPLKQLRNILKPRPIVPTSTLHRNTSSKQLQKTICVTAPNQPTKIRECLSSKSTVRNSKVDSSSRHVSPLRAFEEIGSFVCEEVVKSAVDMEKDQTYRLREVMDKEKEVGVDQHYMKRQQMVNQNVRAILLDWMMELSSQYGLLRATYQQAVCLVDRYLSTTKQLIKRPRIQLLGATALLLSSKLDQLLPRNCSDFSIATNLSYPPQQLSQMQTTLSKTLHWRLRSPTYCFWVETLIYRWTIFRRSLHISQLDFNEQECNFEEKLEHIMHTVIDAAMLDMESLRYDRCEVVCGGLLLGLVYLHGEVSMEEIQLSVSYSARYMVCSGTVLVGRYCDFVRKLLGTNLERELLEPIQFIASYFFAIKKSPPIVSTTTKFGLYQQHTGKGLDCLARRKYLSQQCPPPY